ncbi:MAG: DUF92 domain-containing protein, partial [Anaerolineales bacterium]
MIQIVIGFSVATLIAVGAYGARALSLSGAFATVIVGTLTFGWGGLTPAVLLVLFFVSSTALTRYRRGRKTSLSPGFSKGGRRDYGQVFANGILAAVCSFMYGVQGNEIWLAGIVGALAAVTADTWGTELGVLSNRTPRLLTTGAHVPPGTSGGVTFPGSAAGFAGAGLIGLAAALLELNALWLIVGGLAGMLGMFLDSLLGATIQVMYHCPHCEVNTEQHPQHKCGTQTSRVRGISWVNNDVVNLL